MPHARIVAHMGGGDIDLTTAEGILRAQVLGSVAEFESRRKGERVHARALQRSKEERRMMATTRPSEWRDRLCGPVAAGAERAHGPRAPYLAGVTGQYDHVGDRPRPPNHRGAGFARTG
ncbi:hypothetical protein GCM10023350_43930 [Nocardioides endophyticus]|uniref:Resolvase/invertase-type recombinase catalytic domain-containing protein n=1 Tax=Nocardioides endophyticus TaxID=1353775 RepID=A0ABP8ZDX3_9ACTN